MEINWSSLLVIKKFWEYKNRCWIVIHYHYYPYHFLYCFLNSVYYYYYYYFYHKGYLEEKEKTMGSEGGFFTNETVWTCLYVCYLCTNVCLFVCLFVCFVFWLFLAKNFCFLEFKICACKFDKNANKNLFKNIIFIWSVLL